LTLKPRRHFTLFSCLIVILLITLGAHPAAAQTTSTGTIDSITVHGASLVGNLVGDSPDRHVTVYLPPSYRSQPNRRYPVVYMLHGFTDSDSKWFGGPGGWMNLKTVADASMSSGVSKEMILVVPNANNAFHGSFYSSSVTIGDWGNFIARDLVSYIDQHYRTIARPESRGLAGHSMGGYGTVRIGLERSDVFSSIYALSPCCLEPMNGIVNPQLRASAEKIRTLNDVDKADFYTLLVFSVAAAWSPNPKNPPLYLDLPFGDSAPSQLVLQKWVANAPMVLIDQTIPNLKRLHAIAFDAGAQDEFKAIPASLVILDRELNTYGIAHTYETYDGTHISGIAQRIGTKVLPFFSKNLSFEESVASGKP
jgi:S-formylglutathione hydrolase FrmB